MTSRNVATVVTNRPGFWYVHLQKIFGNVEFNPKTNIVRERHSICIDGLDLKKAYTEYEGYETAVVDVEYSVYDDDSDKYYVNITRRVTIEELEYIKPQLEAGKARLVKERAKARKEREAQKAQKEAEEKREYLRLKEKFGDLSDGN